MNNGKLIKNGDNFSILKRKKNNIIYTSPAFAKRVVDYLSPQFKPGDTFLEPCAGDNAFYDALPEPKDWCEIARGKDFLTYNTPANWCITNFPWSADPLRPLSKNAYKLCDNVVHLIRIHNVLGTFARQRDYLEQGHSLKEIIVCNWKEAFLNKDPEGFCLGVFHMQKNYAGGTKWTHWNE